MSPVLHLTPSQLAERRDLALFDVRPLEERYGLTGFLPGSRSAPAEELLLSPYAFLPQTGGAVLFCLRGHRSQRAAEQLAARGVPGLYTLDGGTLSWGADGFPLCGLREVSVPDTPAGPERLVRRIVSCFVAESAEATAAHEEHDGFDPFQMARAVFDEERGAHELHLAAARRALDRLASLAWRRGHPLDAIARNLDEMGALCARTLPA